MIRGLSSSPILLASVLLLSAASPTSAAIECFLRIDGATGESTSQDHLQDVDVLSWQWGASSSATTHASGGGAGIGKTFFQDLSLVKYVDQSTPALMKAVATGGHFNRAILYVRVAGLKPVQFYKIVCENLIVSSLQIGGSGGQSRLTESITLNFQRFGIEYVRIDPKGSTSPAVSFDWDIAKGKAAGLSFADPIDFDLDGLPDSWERAFGTQVNVADGDADLDGDGATNFEEFLAGTNPSSRDSVFVARLSAPNAAGVATLSWPSVAGVSYRVLISDRPEGEFQLLRTVPSNGTGTTSTPITANLSKKFFRVEASPAP